MPIGSDELGGLISRRKDEIESRWLKQVLHDIGGTKLDLTQFKDGLGDYLTGLARILRASGPDKLRHDGTSLWEGVAREHAITRVQQGFEISELLHEFKVLRQILFAVIPETGLLEVNRELLEVLSDAVSASVQSYVESRDYSARQAEAEHIGFITHELRNPLTVCRLAATQLKLSATAESTPIIDRLFRGLDAIGALINGVLLTERMTAGQATPNIIPARLGELMTPALSAAQGMANQKGLDFETHYEPELLVLADPELARSAIQNLADNAVKFTDQGTVKIDAYARASDVVIRIHDHCKGLSAEELKVIFEPYHRGHRKGSGSGLGLAIAKQAVEAQHGTIGVESTQGDGCEFSVTLPIFRGSDPTASAHQGE